MLVGVCQCWLVLASVGWCWPVLVGVGCLAGHGLVLVGVGWVLSGAWTCVG